MGGDKNQWHVHNVKFGHIKFGPTCRIDLIQNNDEVNRKRFQEAIILLDVQFNGGERLPNYDELKATLERLRDSYGPAPLWSDEAKDRAERYLASGAGKEWLNQAGIKYTQFDRSRYID